jgi:hypothetical protein
MRFLDVGQHAVGVIAIGQEAHGVIAIGQMATGDFALGQIAFGVVAVGQVGVGIWSAGMVGAGVAWFFGLGVGGRGPVPLIPSLQPPRVYPTVSRFPALRAGPAAGWLRGALRLRADGVPALEAEGLDRPVKISVALRRRAAAAIDAREVQVVAYLRPVGADWICDRLMSVPSPTTQAPGFYPRTALRLSALVWVATMVWVVALFPLVELLLPGLW